MDERRYGWSGVEGGSTAVAAANMGHSSITETLDRYGHLMPGSEEEAAGMLDAFLDRARAADVPEDQLVA
jgi:hypothetical protein